MIVYEIQKENSKELTLENLLKIKETLKEGVKSSTPVPLKMTESRNNKLVFSFDTDMKIKSALAIPLLVPLESADSYYKAMYEMLRLKPNNFIYSLNTFPEMVDDLYVQNYNLEARLTYVDNVACRMQVNLEGTILGRLILKAISTVGVKAIAEILPFVQQLNIVTDTFKLNRQEYYINEYKTIIY